MLNVFESQRSVITLYIASTMYTASVRQEDVPDLRTLLQMK